MSQAMAVLPVALGAAGVTMLTAPLAGRLAKSLNMHDRPSSRKAHVSITPYLGGLAILAGWLVSFIASGTLSESVVLLMGVALLAALGFVDDRLDLNPHLRLGLQVLVAVMAWSGGIRFEFFGSIPMDFAITILWITGITNAFNFMDNMDGLSSGIGAIAAGTIGVIALLDGQLLVAPAAFGLGGACLGFLSHNRHPARIFMGDTGSLPVGFALAVLALELQLPGLSSPLSGAIRVAILAPFIIDTSVMAIGRILRGEAIVGGRTDHVSHRFLARGLPVRRVATGFYAAAALCAAIGVIARAVPHLGWIPLGAMALGSIWATATIVKMPILVKSHQQSNDDAIVRLDRFLLKEFLVSHARVEHLIPEEMWAIEPVSPATREIALHEVDGDVLQKLGITRGDLQSSLSRSRRLHAAPMSA